MADRDIAGKPQPQPQDDAISRIRITVTQRRDGVGSACRETHARVGFDRRQALVWLQGGSRSRGSASAGPQKFSDCAASLSLFLKLSHQLSSIISREVHRKGVTTPSPSLSTSGLRSTGVTCARDVRASRRRVKFENGAYVQDTWTSPTGRDCNPDSLSLVLTGLSRAGRNVSSSKK